MDNCAVDLRQWTKQLIDDECRAAYRLYERQLRKHYIAYFERHKELRCPEHPYSARTITAALPPGCGDLQKRIRHNLVHRFARSGRSSQTLALSLIGNAVQNDDSLSWFWNALNLPVDLSERPAVRFEHCLKPTDLGEVPRVTKLDLSVSTPETFLCCEVKWSEGGLGICSCVRDGDGNPRAGFDCSARVRSRTVYWEVAHDFFGLDAVRLPLLPCAMSALYQAIRVAAGARRLSHGRRAVFVLVFDDRNPYFCKTGRWIGWPALLTSLLHRHEHSGLIVRAMSWQRLVTHLPLSPAVRDWAREKHLLPK